MKGTFFLGKSFSSLLITFSEKRRGDGGAAVKWKGDVRTVVSVSTRVSIARGLSTMQEMQVWSLGCEGSPGNPLQYSCLDNPKKRNLEGYIVHGGYKRVEHLVTIKQQGHQEH